MILNSSTGNDQSPTPTPQRSSQTAFTLLLSAILAGLVADLFIRFEERHYRIASEERRQADERSRQAAIEVALKASQAIEKKRIEVFSEYVKDLGSYETKSVYHQIYHANNAQLKMQNLAVEEQVLLIQLLSTKR